MPLTTMQRWASEDRMAPRDLMSVPRRWPWTTGYITATTVAFVILCWAEAAR